MMQRTHTPSECHLFFDAKIKQARAELESLLEFIEEFEMLDEEGRVQVRDEFQDELILRLRRLADGRNLVLFIPKAEAIDTLGDIGTALHRVSIAISVVDAIRSLVG